MIVKSFDNLNTLPYNTNMIEYKTIAKRLKTLIIQANKSEDPAHQAVLYHAIETAASELAGKAHAHMNGCIRESLVDLGITWNADAGSPSWRD